MWVVDKSLLMGGTYPAARRQATGIRPLGVAAVLAQNPLHRPGKIKKSPVPGTYSRGPDEEGMLTRHDVVIVPDVTSLVRLSELAGMDLASLRRDNSELAGRTSTPGPELFVVCPQGEGGGSDRWFGGGGEETVDCADHPIEVAPSGQPSTHQELPTP